jgi:hypothetical protein
MATKKAWRQKQDSERYSTNKDDIQVGQAKQESERGQESSSTQHKSRAQEHVSLPVWPAPSESTRTKYSNEIHQPRNENTTSVGDETTVGSDEERSTVFTRASTQASRATTNARFQEIDYILKSQQKAMEASGRKTYDILNTLDRQFNRIDDIEKQMAAVKLSLEQTNKISERNQKKTSKNLQEMQDDTTNQIDEVREKILDTRGSQQLMSSTMLEIRGQLNILSNLMVAIGNKLDIDTKVTQEKVFQEEMNIHRNAKRTQTDTRSTSTSTSQQSIMSNEGLQDSSFYKSPDKKKSTQSSPINTLTAKLVVTKLLNKICVKSQPNRRRIYRVQSTNPNYRSKKTICQKHLLTFASISQKFLKDRKSNSIPYQSLISRHP